MELTVTQEKLSRALAIVSRVSSAKTGLSILNNILFRTEGNRLLVAATNLEVAATCYIGAKVTKQGEITLPSRLIGEFIANLPKGNIDISSKDKLVTITSGKFSSKMSGVDTTEFPELPSIDEAKAVKYNILVSDFKQAVGQTIITTSTDISRPVLTGIYWHSHEGNLYLVGTDGYRLAEKRLMPTKSEIEAIIPTSALQEVLRTISDDIEEVQVLFDDTQVKFRVGESEITSKLIDGKYPAYRQLIPKENNTVIKVRVDDFTRIVKVAGLFARQAGGSIRFTADESNQQVIVNSIANEYGENTSSADAKVVGTKDITLNSKYVTDALLVMEGEVIEFKFNGKLAACVLNIDTKDVDYTHIIMPLKS